LPGVPGVGEKTAAQLITLYGDLAGVRQAALAKDPATRATIHDKVIAASDYLDVAPTVVRVAADVPIPANSFPVPTEPADRAALSELSEKWNLGTSVTRVMQSLGMAAL
jgi:5'-3' exonuclease